MDSKKIIGTAAALATVFTLGNQVVNAETNSKVEITKTGENNLTIKNGTFDKISNKLIEIKNNAGKIVGYMPANVTADKGENIHQVSTTVTEDNKLEIKDIKTLGKISEAAKPKKGKKKPKAGNINDFIPSSMDYGQAIIQTGEFLVPILALGGGWLGAWAGNILVPIASITNPLGSITGYTLLAVWLGKNFTKNPKVNKAADRVARNIKSVAPFLSSL